MDAGGKNNVSLAHPYHERKSCSKLVKFQPVVYGRRR